MRWRLIAPLLPGRSDDSVRNRWKRLKEEADERLGRQAAANGGNDDDEYPGDYVSSSGRAVKRTQSDETAGYSSNKRHAAKPKRTQSLDDDEDGGEGGQRVSWSSYEDQVIVRAVQELGPRWCAVAARLPSRTDQAVRNRWNRLQQRARVQARTMLNAFQQQQAQ